MLHPGTPNGRIIVHALQAGSVPSTLYVDQFRLPDGRRGYSYDSTVTEDGLTRLADVAVSGNATLRVASDRYYDPISSVGNETLDKEDPDMLGTVRLLAAGVRDDATGAILATDAPEDDAELHVHMRGNPDALPESIQETFASPGIAPPTEAYGAAYSFTNLKFGGEATLAIETTAYAPPGMNELAFSVRDPTGFLIANVTVAPSLAQAGDATLTFPLALFGDYKIIVAGKVALAEYEMTLTMAPPPALDLHLWWENVTYGYQAYLDYRACLKSLRSPDAAISVDSIVDRPPPPQYKLLYVAYGAGGLVSAVAIVVKLASDQVSLAAFRKGK
jgi:hypothetical protein